ncbi:hypothetical protein LXA43DRAFT_1025552 [Ganoderma leucocontextum]|nr:hypothetical protein LXA43DRAFT_1025552 [Ganoderma leucocontextum]
MTFSLTSVLWSMDAVSCSLGKPFFQLQGRIVFVNTSPDGHQIYPPIPILLLRIVLRSPARAFLFLEIYFLVFSPTL